MRSGKVSTSDILARGRRIEKIIIAVAAVLFIAIFAAIFAFRGKISAVSMRIIQFEGTVSLEERGKPKTIRNNARLNGEDTVSTESNSTVKIGLDDYKIVSLRELSRARISKNGRMLELNLENGTLDFEVSKPLEADETMDIKTSTMIVGIRGTAGIVSSIDGVDSVEITEGVVHVTVTNPYTGEVKETDVHAGEKILVKMHADRAQDSIEIINPDATQPSQEPSADDDTEEAASLNNPEDRTHIMEGPAYYEWAENRYSPVIALEVYHHILQYDNREDSYDEIYLIYEEDQHREGYSKDVGTEGEGEFFNPATGERFFAVIRDDSIDIKDSNGFNGHYINPHPDRILPRKEINDQ